MFYAFYQAYRITLKEQDFWGLFVATFNCKIIGNFSAAIHYEIYAWINTSAKCDCNAFMQINESRFVLHAIHINLPNVFFQLSYESLYIIILQVIISTDKRQLLFREFDLQYKDDVIYVLFLVGKMGQKKK